MDLYQLILRNYKVTEYRQRVTYKVTVAPVEEPVTLDEAKNHLRMDGIDADDTLITALIVAAREYCEMYCNRAFITQTITQVYNQFPPSGDVLRIAVSPVQSVSSVDYHIAGTGEKTPWDSSNYVFDNYTEPCEITEANNKTYPATLDQNNVVLVVYVAGYGLASAVPVAIKQAILLMVGHFYLYREDTVSEKRTASERLLNFYRVKRF